MSGEPQAYDPIRWKAGVLILIFSFLFAIVIGRLFWVQVMDAAKYREEAKRQYESRIELRAERGSFFDRHGRDVAVMTRTTSFAVDPTMIERPQLVAHVLSQATNDSASTYLSRIRSAKGRFVWLERGVRTVLYPELDTLKDAGLIRAMEPQREFLYGPVAAQLIGTTDIDNNGLTGLELQYDRMLRGKSGFVIMQRDGRGGLRPGVDPERQAPENGHALKLTLDIEFQRVVEQELRRGVRETDAASGIVAAVDPRTGEILAMASMPTFDPNRLDRASRDAIRVRAITDQYEPGSTMKAITAAALLEEGLMRPDDRVNGLGGSLAIGGQTIRDDHPLGDTTFKGALEQSSNVVFATASKRLDDRVFYKYVRDFGFGIPTGIDLPGEIRGVLKRPDRFTETTKPYMAFGYELSATTLQMLMAYAAIANNGVLMEPHCVRAIVSPDGAVVKEIKPQRVRQVISEATARSLTAMLVGVVENGTGHNARIPGVRIAGKTGTAQQLVEGQYSRESYTASFIGYYPADAPRVCMIVMLDRPRSSIYGGSTAAPIFRRIVQKTMTMLNLDDATQRSIAASADADTVVVPDIRGLRPLTADSVLRRLGLYLDDPADTGIVLTQSPQPGLRIERGSAVKAHAPRQRSGMRPDVKGLTLRRAITVLHDAGYTVHVRGSGRVVQQNWQGTACEIVAE
jgi:cell division protein FtsI (penicillin-binding protein 3)